MEPVNSKLTKLQTSEKETEIPLQWAFFRMRYCSCHFYRDTSDCRSNCLRSSLRFLRSRKLTQKQSKKRNYLFYSRACGSNAILGYYQICAVFGGDEEVKKKRKYPSLNLDYHLIAKIDLNFLRRMLYMVLSPLTEYDLMIYSGDSVWECSLVGRADPS